MKGSIKKVGDNKYRMTVDIGRDPVTNKRKQKVVTVTGTKKDAEKALARIIADADRLLAEAVNRQQRLRKRTEELTFGDYLEEWYGALPRELRENSRRFYRLLIGYIKL